MILLGLCYGNRYLLFYASGMENRNYFLYGMKQRSVLFFEFIILCLALPGFIIVGRHAPFMFAFLWGATAYCYIVMRVFYRDDLRHIWNWRAVSWRNLKPVLVRWIIATIAMWAFIGWYDPERQFGLLRENPGFLPYLMILYPLLSALPQEFIFCSFFFKRYRKFFGQGRLMIFSSALVFAYAHMLYINPVAPVISFIGGLIFARTYWQHKSLALVTIEHGLYGNSLFLVGLGWYFYSGGVVS